MRAARPQGRADGSGSPVPDSCCRLAVFSAIWTKLRNEALSEEAARQVTASHDSLSSSQ